MLNLDLMNIQTMPSQGKILALDLGDQWIGTALSDATLTLARPLKTIKPPELTEFLQNLFSSETIGAVVIGYPKTMGGKISEQTQKVLDVHQALSKEFPQMNFILWDERLSSKRADAAKHAKTKEEKIQSHSRAAAFILDSYLSYLAFQKSFQET